MMESVPVHCTNPFLAIDMPFAKVDSSGWREFCVFAVDISLHTSLLWRHFHRYSDFARLHEQLQEAAGEYSRALPPLPPKVFSPLAPDVIHERQKLLPVYLRELLAICRNDYGEELLADACRPLIDEWLVSDPAAAPGSYAPFKHHFPIIRLKGDASVNSPLEKHRGDGGLWLAMVAAIHIQRQFRCWRGTFAVRKVPTQLANAPVLRSKDLRPGSRFVTLDDRLARKQVGLPLLERMRTLSAQTESPLVERMKALKPHHIELALASSPRARPGDGPRYEVLRAAVIRASYQLDSAQISVVHAGSEVVALEERSTIVAGADGWEPQAPQRVHFRVRISDGWISGRACAGGGHGSEPILKLLTHESVPPSAHQPELAAAEEEGSESTISLEKQPMKITVSSTYSRLGPVEHTVQLRTEAAAFRLVCVYGVQQPRGDVSAMPVRGKLHRDVLEMVRTAEQLRVQELPTAQRQQVKKREQQTKAPMPRPADSPHAIWAQRQELVQLMDFRLSESPASPASRKSQREPLGTLAVDNVARKLA